MADSVRAKVEEIMQACLGDLAGRLSAVSLHPEVIGRIATAHADEFGSVEAEKLGMHMSDWIGDAAFLVALHLFPDRFSDNEIRDGVGGLLVHAPNHIRAACGITGDYVWETFPDDEEGR